MAISSYPDFSAFELGQRHDPLEIDTSEAVRAACIALIGKARRQLILVSRNLDAALFDNAEASEALRQFVLQSRRTQVRILVQDPGPAARSGHRFVDLARHLSTFIEIRVPAREHADYNAAFLVADDVGAVHRNFADRYEAQVSFGDRQLALELSRQFEDMWGSAKPDPALRRLSL